VISQIFGWSVYRIQATVSAVSFGTAVARKTASDKNIFPLKFFWPIPGFLFGRVKIGTPTPSTAITHSYFFPSNIALRTICHTTGRVVCGHRRAEAIRFAPQNCDVICAVTLSWEPSKVLVPHCTSLSVALARQFRYLIRGVLLALTPCRSLSHRFLN
jgi:hypothetical protein